MEARGVDDKGQKHTQGEQAIQGGRHKALALPFNIKDCKVMSPETKTREGNKRCNGGML